MSFLIYINELGPNYKGDNIYEFLFGDNLKEVWGENWENKPSNGYPHPPDVGYVKKVGTLTKNDIKFEVIQNSDYFCMSDAQDGVICLGWEKENDTIDFALKSRLVFRYGEDEQSVKNKLYERDIVLEFEKNIVYEN